MAAVREARPEALLSKRDMQLVNQLGVPLSRFADALSLSRQAVSKGVKSNVDYFKPSVLSKLLQNFKDNDEILFELAKSSVKTIYRSDADRILQSVHEKDNDTLDTSIPGEFTIVCADVLSFKNNLPACNAQLKTIIANFEKFDGHIEFVIHRNDHRYVKYYEQLCNNPSQFSEVFCQYNLSLFPTTMMRISKDLDIQLFGCNEQGFIGLSKVEAERIRRTILDLRG